MNTTAIENDNRQAIIIFSVHQNTKTLDQNESTHSLAIQHLKDNGIAFKEVKGVYTYDDGTTCHEQSLLVNIDNDRTESIINKLCLETNQESYLYSDETRDSYLMRPESETTTSCIIASLGKLREVSRHEALTSTAYTYCPLLERYYACKK